MIFGFNTDVAGKDAVYHVQTEDRGTKNPIVDSMIYVRGKIVDRRRTSYDPAQATPAQIEEMVRKQHKELVEAIRSGTFVPTGHPNSAEAADPLGYAVELLNPADLYRDGQLCFELAVREKAKAAVPQEVSLDVRWVLAGAVAEARTLHLEGTGRTVVSFPVPANHLEAALLVRAEGAAGKEFSKFLARAASEPRA